MKALAGVAALVAVASFIPACGYAGETGADYEHSLAAKPVWSALQQAEWNLRGAAKRPYVYNADSAADVDTIAFPARSGSGYVAFAAKARHGQVLSIPSDAPIAADPRLVADLQRRGLISGPVAAELGRRSGS